MTLTVSAKRIDDICDALTAAKAGWPDIARKLPEFVKLSYGLPTGPGMHRPWVLLRGEHEHFEEVPLRLLQFDKYVWALKWEPLHRIEEKVRRQT